MFGEKDLKYEVFKDYNIPFDEKGSSVGVVRLVQWHSSDKEADESKAKLEIRKISVNSDGETLRKGYTFSTPEGPHELVKGLIDVGFGDTKEILRSVRKRDDFLEAAKTINDENNEFAEGETFDMRDLLLGMEEDDEKEVE